MPPRLLVLACLLLTACAGRMHYEHPEFGPKPFSLVTLSQPRAVHGGTYFMPIANEALLDQPLLIEAHFDHPPQQATLDLCAPTGDVLLSHPMESDQAHAALQQAVINPVQGPFTLYIHGTTQDGHKFRQRAATAHSKPNT